MTTFTYQDFDRQLWERELEDFVPAHGLRHAHAHVV